LPRRQKPLRVKTGTGGGKIVHFDKKTCDLCPRQSDCPVKRVKKSASISYDAKALRLARRRAKEKTAEFREVYRFRAGAEGTMSDLDRMTGLKHLRVRGMPQVRLAAVLKATGLNILRSVAFKNRLKRQEKAEMRSDVSENGLLGVIKELLRCVYDKLQASAFGVAINCRRMADLYRNLSIRICDCIINNISKYHNDPYFYVFSDDPAWVETNLQIPFPTTFIKHNGPCGHEDLRLMSLCRHNIIANSSFSWWGAWLNSYPDKIVVAPRLWFNDPSINTLDLIPAGWIKV
jgi:hypothetical protein